MSEEAEAQPELLREATRAAPVRRLDETTAAPLLQLAGAAVIG